MRILDAEDEPLIRWAVAESLVGVGHAVAETSDDATAGRVPAEATELFDVVLLDYR